MTILRRYATPLLLAVGSLLYLVVETAPRIHF